MLDANTLTERTVEGEQSEDEISKSWLHTLLVHDEAGMTAEPHDSPDIELV